MSVHEFHVIHLDRRRDRKRAFGSLNGLIQGLRFHFVSAIDGQRVDANKVRDRGLLASDAEYENGHIACALSHRKILTVAVEQQRPALVCEDDAVLRSDFATQWETLRARLPADWDIVLFGYNFDSAVRLDLIPGVQQFNAGFTGTDIQESELRRFQRSQQPVMLTKLHNAFGTLAYAVSPKGAAAILDHCFPLRSESVFIPCLHRSLRAFSFDCLMNQKYAQWQAFAAFPPLAISPNDKLQSDTAANSRVTG